MSDLVSRLSAGRHAVSAMRYKSAAELEQAVAQGFVLVKFTDTQGGTELGFKIDKDKSRVAGEGTTLQLVGPLTLDYVPVECEVDLDPQTLAGTGTLRPVA